jgi:tetratricopeptide (TPR) repeat protein
VVSFKLDRMTKAISMENKSDPYDAVFHFRDVVLFEAFMAGIPASRPREYLRNDQALRNRCFAGFRITNTLPTNDQIKNALRREIVERNNGDLASKLCALWVRERPQLTKEALACFGVLAEKPEDSGSWITQIHDILDESKYQNDVQTFARTLGAKFNHDELLIFASVISYGRNQKEIREIVECERIEKERAASETKINQLVQITDSLKLELERKKQENDVTIATFSKEQEDLDGKTALLSTTVDQLTKDLERIRSERQRQERDRETANKQLQSVLKSIRHERQEFSKLVVSVESKIHEAEKQIKAESDHILSLNSELVEVDQAIILLLTHQVTFDSAEAPDGQSEELIEVMASGNPTDSSEASGPNNGSETVARVIQTATLGNNAICYQAVQRIFRNALVTFLRVRLSRLFPQDHSSRLKNIFGDEWIKGADNATRSRQNLGTTTLIRDDYDLLGTNHFYNVFERFYDKLFTAEAGQHSSLPKPVKPRFLGNLKAIKDFRDPLSHPVEAEVSFQEAHHLLYSAQEIMKWIGCTEEADGIDELAEKIGNFDAEVQSQVRRLPTEDSIYLEFVGRNSLLNELSACFDNPDNKRCLLAGDGGKGKSAAAFRFVQSRPKCLDRFQLILWLSAKKRRFREGASSTIETPDFTNLGEAVDRLLSEFGATTEEMSRGSSAKKRLLLDYMNEFPAFIIADDIDTVLEDEDVVGLFSHEIPHTQSAVLLTSRRSIPGIRAFNVPGFDSEEAEEFIKSRIRLYGLNSAQFTPSVIRRIAKATDSSPLYMDDLLRLAKIVDVGIAMKTWEEKGGDEARKYALQREVEKLSHESRKVLVAAAVQDDPISFDELKHIVEFSDDRLISALSELQTLFLFPKAPAVEGEQRYQININTKKLVRMVEGASAFYARIDTRSKALAGKLPNIEHGTISSIIRQAFLRVNAGQQGDAEAILLKAIERYPNAGDLHGFLGYVCKRSGRVVDARVHFESAYKLRCLNLDTYIQWVRMEAGEREWLKVIDVADRALKIAPDAYEIVERKAYALRQAGHDLQRGLHYEKAAKMWTDAVEFVARSIKSPETLPVGARTQNSSMYNTIVVSLNMLRHYKERNHWLERWEREHPDDPQVTVQKEYLNRGRSV